MTAPTAQRPSALSNPSGGKPAGPKCPPGAAKMSRMFVNDKGLPQKSSTPIPVDENDRPTAHVQRRCPHTSPVNGGGKERCGDRDWYLPTDPDVFCRAHGDKLEAVQSGPSPFALTLSAAREMHGASAMPWLIPAGAVAADLALHLADVGPAAGLVALPLAGAGYLGAKRTLTRRALKRNALERGEKSGRRYKRILGESRRYSMLAGEAGLWAGLLAATNVTQPFGAAVVLAGLGRWAYGCRHWWKAADERRCSADVVKVDVAKVADSAAAVKAPDEVELRALTTWKTIIGCPGGPLAGTELVGFAKLPNCEVGANERTLMPNWTAKVVATRSGTVNMREARPALPGRIAAAYGVSYADVSFAADENDLSVAWLRVQPDNPLAETRMWTGVQATDWSKGLSVVGRFDDGKPIPYVWWDEGGAAHDLLGGSSGSGKSEFIAQLLLTSLHSEGMVLDWLGDPQSGQSFGALRDHVDWFAPGGTQIEFLLLGAVKEMYRRNDILSRNYIKTWQPSLEMPLLVITLDEVQSYLGDSGVVHDLVMQLAGMARKCGLKLRLSTQIIAAYNLGGDTYIKDQVKSGQTFTFRSNTDQAARSSIEGDSPIDPTALPTRWGQYTCAAGQKTAGLVFVQGLWGRDVYGRTDYTGNEMNRWLLGPDGKPLISPGVFSRDAQEVSGVLWGDRKERARMVLEGGRDDEDILSGGRAVELIEAASVSAASGKVTKPASAAESSLPERARDKVFAAAVEIAQVKGFVEKPALVADLEGKVAPKTVDKAITDLVDDGFFVRVKNGVYKVRGVEAEQGEVAE